MVESAEFGGGSLFAEPESARSELSLAAAQAVKSDGLALRQGVGEFVSTLSAGLAGPIAYSLAHRFGPVGSLAAMAAAGGITKYASKAGAEAILLNSSERTLGKADLAWGALDGLAGTAASLVEMRAARHGLAMLGRYHAGGSISQEMMELVGRKAVDSSITSKIVHSSYRGLSAGTAGSFIWSLPHGVYDHRERLNSKEGLNAVASDTLKNTAFGAVFGLGLSAGISSAANSREIMRYAKAALSPGDDLSRINILHFNDMHSALLGNRASLPQLASEAKRLQQSLGQKNGGNTLLFELGDNYSGNVAAGFTDVAYVETRAVNMMKPDAFIPGNHVADAAHGKVDVDKWVSNFHRVESELGRELNAIATNIDLLPYPGFIGPQGKYKTVRTVSILGADNKPETVGLIGLVTKELADSSQGTISYRDAVREASQAIESLNSQGVNKVIVLSHLGRKEDINLAREVKGISAIIGAHSHDIEPVPLWVTNKANDLPVPIVQAGSKAGWLGELNLVLNRDGSANKYLSRGRLHEIHEGIKPDAELKSFIDKQIGQVRLLEDRTYPVNVTEAFSHDGIRGKTDTPLARLITSSILEGVNKRLPQINSQLTAQGMKPFSPFDIMLKQSGDIREGLPKGPLNHRILSDLFLNTGTAQRELSELVGVKMTGRQIEQALNFGVHDLPAAKSGTVSRLNSLLREPPVEPISTYSGNFLQVAGLRYSYDLSRPAAGRLVSVETFDQASRSYVPLDRERVYSVLSLFHPVDKWGASGKVFGQTMGSQQVRSFVEARPVALSQVDLVAEFLTKRSTVSPSEFVVANIFDLSTAPWRAPVVPGPRGLSTLGALDLFGRLD